MSSGGAAAELGPVAYSVAPNPNSSATVERERLWIGGESLSVTQSGLTCALDVPTRNVAVAAAGVTGAHHWPVSFNALTARWKATANVPWILLVLAEQMAPEMGP